MAVVTVKATAISNRDSVPSQKTASHIMKGNLHEAVGTAEVTSGDSIGSKYLMGQISSSARMSQLLVYSDDMGTTTAADIGLYDNTANGGAVVDADLFASALVLNAGALNGVDITHESAVFGVEDCEKRIWEALGLSEDPFKDYDIAATLTGASDGTGTLSMRARYAI